MMKLIQPFDPILYNGVESFDFSNPPFNPVEFSRNLIAFMNEKNGIGLSAVQVGVPYNIFSLSCPPTNIVMFNAKIVWHSETTNKLDEACLSFPGLVSKVERWDNIRVRYQDEYGELTSRSFIGMTAKCIQHELEHSAGTPFFRNMSKLKFDMVSKKCNKKYGIDYSVLKGKLS